MQRNVWPLVQQNHAAAMARTVCHLAQCVSALMSVLNLAKAVALLDTHLAANDTPFLR